jgi:putative nucleotidyltransferase with HDIG domain
MSATIDVQQLRVGMYIHLDLGWWAHPFALSSFKIGSPQQIETLRTLGLRRVRWSPQRSDPAVLDDAPPSGAVGGAASVVPTVTAPGPEPRAAQAPQPDTLDAQAAALAAQQEAARICERQYQEAGQAWRHAAGQLAGRPAAAREIAEGLTRALLDKMMVDGELCIRIVGDGGGDRAGAHAINVAVLSMLMARAFGFDASELSDVGLGALLHDVGKFDLPDRVRQDDPQFGHAEQAAYREHVAHGLAQGRRMGLSAGALQVIEQHHELADGTGFPQRLSLDRMSAAARVVALVNRYDNLCNPRLPSQALTPHEALSTLFAQCRGQFDASMLNAFIRMMGVYPPGSVVQLTDDRYAMVVTVNSSRPLKPRVRVHDPQVAAEQALLLDLEQQPDLGIRRSLRPAQLPGAVVHDLAPRERMAYFFEPAMTPSQDAESSAPPHQRRSA